MAFLFSKRAVQMKTTKLYSRFTTLFLLLLFGIALGAKTAGLDSSRFIILIAALGALSLFHFQMMRKKFAQYRNTAA